MRLNQNLLVLRKKKRVCVLKLHHGETHANPLANTRFTAILISSRLVSTSYASYNKPIPIKHIYFYSTRLEVEKFERNHKETSFC